MNNPELMSHIQNMQDHASRLFGVIQAIDFLDNASECSDGRTALIHVAVDISQHLLEGLDSANMPEDSAHG